MARKTKPVIPKGGIDMRPEARIKRHRDIVPAEYEITPDEDSFWIQTDKGVSETDGYGPTAIKLFVQPVREKYLDVLDRTFRFLSTQENVSLKFIDREFYPYVFSDAQEKIVIYTEGWHDLRDKVALLCEGFGADCYLLGSGRDVTKGFYGDNYGARFTQQINPLLHVRMGGRLLHSGLNDSVNTIPVGAEEKEFLGKYTGNANPDTQEAQHLIKRMQLSEDLLWDLGDYSLGQGGILQLNVGGVPYVLDPRRTYQVGSSPYVDVTLPRGTSSSHALISYEPDSGYFVTDTSRNGTYVNGQRISKSPIKGRDEIRFCKVSALVETAWY